MKKDVGWSGIISHAVYRYRVLFCKKKHLFFKKKFMVIFCNFTIYYLSFLELALHLSYSWCRWNQKIGKAFQKIGFGQLRGIKHRRVHVFAWAATKPSGATCHRYIRWRWQRRSWLQRYIMVVFVKNRPGSTACFTALLYRMVQKVFVLF